MSDLEPVEGAREMRTVATPDYEQRYSCTEHSVCRYCGGGIWRIEGLPNWHHDRGTAIPNFKCSRETARV